MIRFKEVQGVSEAKPDEDAQGRKILRIEYKGVVETRFILKEYQEIEVRLSCKEGFPLDYRLAIVMPNPKSPGQHLLIG